MAKPCLIALACIALTAVTTTTHAQTNPFGGLFNALRQSQQRQQQQQSPAPNGPTQTAPPPSSVGTDTISQQQADQYRAESTRSDKPSENDPGFKACMASVGKDGKDPYAEHEQCEIRYVALATCKPRPLSASEVAQIGIELLPTHAFGDIKVDPRQRDVILINNTANIYLWTADVTFLDTVQFNKHATHQPMLGTPPAGGRYNTEVTNAEQEGQRGFYDKIEITAASGCIP